MTKINSLSTLIENYFGFSSKMTKKYSLTKKVIINSIILSFQLEWKRQKSILRDSFC